MRTNLGWLASVGYGSVKVYDVMVAYATPTALPVPFINFGNGEVLAFLRCRTMYYDFFDCACAHGFIRFITFT